MIKSEYKKAWESFVKHTMMKEENSEFGKMILAVHRHIHQLESSVKVKKVARLLQAKIEENE